MQESQLIKFEGSVSAIWARLNLSNISTSQTLYGIGCCRHRFLYVLCIGRQANGLRYPALGDGGVNHLKK